MAQAHKLTSDQESNIVKMYQDGISRKTIAEQLGHATDKCVLRILKKYGVSIRRGKYNIDQHIFDVIDSADKAYWLGFIVGDRCIHNSHYYLSIKLAAIDKPHLVKFANFMGLPETTVKDGIGTYNNPIVYIYVSSKPIVQTLMQKGIEQVKSGHEHVPSGIPSQFVRDYIRGLIDADGCIQTGDHSRLDLSNSMENIEFMQSYLTNTLSVKPGHIRDHQGTYRIYYSGLQRIYLILKHLYYDETITYLDRKYERAKIIFDDYEHKAAHK